ncbi:RDD family protein [Exiguobacterium sp. s22]|uniref:RDD family protein n=1 Tax=Exiguobacterium sp. s22 TaxID=2751272 RepID=UPI001BECFC0E|nr:RDD family protein [Exiguobacterium sp. s22]
MIAVAVPLWKRAVAGQIDQLVFQTPAKLIEKAVRKKIWPDKEVKRYYLPTVVTMAGEVYCMLYQKGQTLGDRVVGIRVVSADGRPLSLEQVVKRTLYKDVVYPATLGIPLIRALQQMKSNKDLELPHDEFANTKLISTK